MAMLGKLLGSRKGSADGWIEADELSAQLAGPAAPLVVDVRGPDEFAGPLGHIDGARNIPLAAFAAHAPGLLAEARPVVLVCHTDRRSSAAAAQLRQAGGTDVNVLRGGMVGWRSGQRG